MARRTQRDRTDPSVARCQRGAVSVEYIIVVALMGLTLTATLVTLGPGMLLSWSHARAVLYGRAP